MKTAFTLIELLVVIAIIAILAAMVIPITGAVNRTKMKAKARAEFAQVETAIEAYKAKLGFYPPDNPGQFPTNQLYYELLGTTYNATAGSYQTLDGSANMTAGQFTTAFPGGKVTGFVNCARGSGDEGKPATAFLTGLKPGQVCDLTPAGNPTAPTGIRYLVCSLGWPPNLPPYFGVNGANPYRYNSSNPTNNPGSFDLWVDVMIGGKTNRLSNWSREILTVTAP